MISSNDDTLNFPNSTYSTDWTTQTQVDFLNVLEKSKVLARQERKGACIYIYLRVRDYSECFAGGWAARVSIYN